MKKICKICKKVFFRPTNISYKRWEKRKYCSPKCYNNDEEINKRMSIRFMGENNPMYGTKGEKNPFFKDKSPTWKGENVSYGVLHKWVRRNKYSDGHCEQCGENKKRLELANISHKYKRDINDYKYLCSRCHRKFDITPKIKKRLLKTGYKVGHNKTYDWTGKKHKPETIRKMSIAKLEYWKSKNVWK